MTRPNATRIAAVILDHLLMDRAQTGGVRGQIG